MGDAVVLKHMPDFDGRFGRIAGIGVNQQRCLIAQRTRNHRHDLFGTARPLVLIMSDFGPDTELESVEAMFATKAQETFLFIGGRNVALHRRSIGPERAGRAADQRANRFFPRVCPPCPIMRYRHRPWRGADRRPETCVPCRGRGQAWHQYCRSQSRAHVAQSVDEAPRR